jgi:putative transposase
VAHGHHEHRTGEGKLYLCAIKDLHSHRIVGYSIDGRMKASLAVAALDRKRWETRADLRLAIATLIEGSYHRKRRHKRRAENR